MYSEGQRRYVETFSSYARQFLDRMDKPRFDEAGGIDGIPPSIAIDQTNPVRTSRSTVGTMTELNDHLKLLFARAAVLHCRGCGAPVRRDSPQSIMSAVHDAGLDRIVVTFDVPVPRGVLSTRNRRTPREPGYTRVHREHPDRIEVIADRLRLNPDNRSRAVEAIENALKAGRGRLTVYRLDAQRSARSPRRFSTTLHCAGCDIEYREPVPSMFSFNSPLGACETCRGFGRTMGIDYGLVVPDESKSLREGAVRPLQSKSYRQCQRDLVRYARRRGVELDRAWRELDDATREWVLEGEAEFDEDGWYGARRFFDWLETKSYRMHIRVLLSRYRPTGNAPPATARASSRSRSCGGSAAAPTPARRSGTPPRIGRPMRLSMQRHSRSSRDCASTTRCACRSTGAAASSTSFACAHRSTRRPGCCWPRFAGASDISWRSASATSRWTASRAR